MRTFIPRKMMLVTMMALLFAAVPAMAQKAGSISPATRLVIADRDGKLSLETPQNLQGQVLTTQSKGGNQTLETTSFDNIQPFATPFTRNGKKVVQCWIEMGNGDYAALERLGVEILCKFKDRVTANVPVDAIERVAAISTVSKVSVAKKLQKKTYRSRILTNVDDVLNFSSDAQTAGLLKAYDGTGVVLGVIDTSIDFGHPMFKDANGNSRIKKKYIYNTTTKQLEEYTGDTAYNTDETHGTHTSTIAGGSDYTATAYVYTTGTRYTTVSNAKFGGMAPGTDLVLCDLGEETTDANIAACIKLISDYADAVGKPCVTSLSLGGHYGPHDGTGNMADICAQYTDHGKIIVYAAGNEGEDNIYLGKNASASSPAMSVLTSQTRSSYSVDYGAVISYARTPDVELAARYYVVDTSTNSIVWTSEEISTEYGLVDGEGNLVLYGREIGVDDVGADGTTPLSNFFTDYDEEGSFICCYIDKDSHNNKWNIETLLYYLVPNDNKYKIGMSVYPKTGTCNVDSWPVNYIDFTASSATVNGNRFTAGTNDCSISDDATFPSVISVGSYVSSSAWYGGTDSSNRGSYTYNGTYLDISTFSSYQLQGSGPLGTKLPWITAPGEVIIAGYNSGYTPSDLRLYAYGTNKVLGAMQGTSMATPCVAGICALWLQVDPSLTPDEVKTIMAETAIKDSYVTGTNASHFGNGKIDALAGIEKILATKKFIFADPQTANITTKPNESKTATVNVKGRNLTGNITATLTDANGVFSIDPTSIDKATALSSSGATLTITYTPTAEGNHTATITLSSEGANDVTITINGSCYDGGTASDEYLDIAKYKTIDDAGWRKALVNNIYKYIEYENQEVAWLTLPVYGGFVGARYAVNSSTVGSGQPQKWIDTSLGTSNTYGGTTWTNTASATNPFQGSSAYFTTTTERAIGYNSKNNTDIRSVTFNVTNTNKIMLSGTGRSGSSTSYPAMLRIYECNFNADGHIAIIESTKKDKTSSSTSAFTLTSDELDPTKIYKVEVSIYRGYLYEIGFQTPLKKAEIIATSDEFSGSTKELTFETYVGESVSKTFNVQGSKLKGDITATLTTNDGNVFSINPNPTSISMATATNGTGQDITVTFTPTEEGNYSDTITLASQNATSVTVTLNGKAVKASLSAEPTDLTFSADPGSNETGTATDTQSFTVTGEHLKGNVTATLSDDNGVFSINTTSINKTDAEAGATVNVTFNPSAMGIYEGKVTLTSDGVEPVVVNLTGSAGYKVTIGDYGLTTLYLDKPLLIPYDRYEDLLGVYYAWGVAVQPNSTTYEIKLKYMDNDIPAYTAVVIQGNSGDYYFPPINPGESSELKYTSLLSGSLVRTPTVDVQNANQDAIVMTLGKGSNGYVGFYRYKGTYLNANKAYLLYKGNAGPNANINGFTFNFGDDATGIVEAGISTSDGPWYTIQGMRLEGQPRQRGIYIHNGKTVVVK